MENLTYILKKIWGMFLKLIQKPLSRFIEANIFDKLIVILTIPAFFAVVMPVGRFYIFETWSYINNPLAVYLIGIAAVMAVTLYFKGIVPLVIRLSVSVIYLIAVIYIHFAGGISKGPYELTNGYFLNIILPPVYVIFSFLSYLYYGRK